MRYTISFVIICATLCSSCGEKSEVYKKYSGPIFGTSFNIEYEYPEKKDLDKKILDVMNEFDQSLSTYKPQSVISRINSNDPDVVPDVYFRTVFNRSKQISERTDGCFDITVAPLVNAYGFGFDPSEREIVSSQRIEDLLSITGYQKVRIQGDEVIKDDPRVMLDVSAIAKGYAVDVVSLYLESEGVDNYLVEIGGELRCKGLNSKGLRWKVGVDKPLEDLLTRQIQVVLNLSDKAMATSGNYRQFYRIDEVKYSHTIDPKTGRPVTHNLLSATVLAPDCMTADAFATAFMVMGLERSMEIVNSDPDLEGYFIYDVEGELNSSYSEGVKNIIEDLY